MLRLYVVIQVFAVSEGACYCSDSGDPKKKGTFVIKTKEKEVLKPPFLFVLLLYLSFLLFAALNKRCNSFVALP